MDDGASEYDDTREFCENCDEALADGQAVHRCGEIAWHASCGGPCGECAATTKGAA